MVLISYRDNNILHYRNTELLYNAKHELNLILVEKIVLEYVLPRSVNGEIKRNKDNVT